MSSLFSERDVEDQDFIRDLRKNFIMSMTEDGSQPSGYDAERYLTALKDYEESTFKKAALVIRGASVVTQDASNALLASLLNKLGADAGNQIIDITPSSEDKPSDDVFMLPEDKSAKDVLPGEDRIGSPSDRLYDEVFGGKT